MTIDSKDISRIIEGYCEQFYANKTSNLDEMDKFLKGIHHQISLKKKNRQLEMNNIYLLKD